MTVGAWLLAYLSRMPAINAPGQVTVLGMLSAVFVGGIIAARYSSRGVTAAVLAGGVSGLLNLLILGSMWKAIKEGGSLGTAPAAALWMGGSIAFNAVVAGIGGLFGQMFPSQRRGQIRWTAVFAFVLTVATLPLISAGGLVTAFRAGLAVPDWPQSYGYNMFLFPLSQMQANHGNFYEHAHRLMGSLVGLTSLTVALYVSIAEKRAWVKAMAWGIFLAVCIQGVLGGTRVTEKSTALAITHGVFAQLVFAAMASLAAICSERFVTAPAVKRLSAPTEHVFSGVLVAALVLQLMLGALVRHSNSPAMAHLTNMVVMLHILMATFVAMMAVAVGFRAWGLHGDVPPVKHAGLAIMALLVLQLLLGITALVVRPGPEAQPTVAAAFLTTAHQANGALLLASSAVLAVWMRRMLAPGEAEAFSVDNAELPVAPDQAALAP